MQNQNDKIVAQVVQHLRPGGIETMVLALMKHQPFKTVIFSLEGTKEEAIARWPSLANVSSQLVFLNKRPGFSSLVIWQLSLLFKQHRVSAVHTHHIGPLLYGGIAARLANISKRIHTEHDAWHLNNFKQRSLQKLLLRLVKPIVVADAFAVAKKIRQYLNHHDITLIHNGIDTDKFVPGNRNNARSQLNLPTGVVLIGNAGRLESIKGQDLLISAISQFSSSVHLAIAGGGSCEALLKQQVAKLNLEQQVHFLGPLDNMLNFYQSLDLFCLPSRQEGLPLSPMEAQACGIPALITNVGGCAEAICQTTGLLVERDNVEQLVSAIEIMLSRRRQTNPREFIAQYRNVQGMANAYTKLICS
ncbi:MAG: glycosyltransferase [Gammaproteobacteria bacterium]|nr:glycosyltransferase [Gammaproteobacteria bacterium]